jgi:hypothetical protein
VRRLISSDVTFPLKIKKNEPECQVAQLNDCTS